MNAHVRDYNLHLLGEAIVLTSEALGRVRRLVGILHSARLAKALIALNEAYLCEEQRRASEAERDQFANFVESLMKGSE